MFHLAQASLEPWFYVVAAFKPRGFLHPTCYMLHSSSGLSYTLSHPETCDNALKQPIIDMKVSKDVGHLNESLERITIPNQWRGKLTGLWVSAEKMGSQQQGTGTYKQRDLLWPEEPTMRAHGHTQAMQEGWRSFCDHCW